MKKLLWGIVFIFVLFTQVKAYAELQISGDSLIIGFVNDADDNALPDVTVTLDGADYSESTVTDEDGAFEFRNLSSGDYTLTCEKDGYQTYTKGIRLGNSEYYDIGTITLEKVVPTPTPSPSPTPTPTDETGITGTWKGTFEGQNVQMYSVVFKFKETDKTSGGNRNFTGIYRAKNKNTGRISKGFIEGTLENEGNRNFNGAYHLSFEGKQTKPCKGRIKNGNGSLYSKDDQIFVYMKILDCQGKIVIYGTLDRQQILQP